MQDKIFESMVSLRERPSDPEPHLGLDLYVVRLIVDFHAGTVHARNLVGAEGVRITVSLPMRQ